MRTEKTIGQLADEAVEALNAALPIVSAFDNESDAVANKTVKAAIRKAKAFEKARSKTRRRAYVETENGFMSNECTDKQHEAYNTAAVAFNEAIGCCLRGDNILDSEFLI